MTVPACDANRLFPGELTGFLMMRYGDDQNYGHLML